MAVIKQLNNGETGLSFRTNLNDNFKSLNDELTSLSGSVVKKTDVDKIETKTNDLDSKLTSLKNGYNNIFVTSSNNQSGTKNLPQDSSSETVTLVGNDHFEQVTDEMNSAIQNIIKGDYLRAGEGIELTKEDSGVTIKATVSDGGSSSGSGSSVNSDWQHSNPNLLINWDWRHPSSHRGIYSFIKKDSTVETAPKPSIDCWEINFPNIQNSGYSFWDAEEEVYAAYQGTSPTDNGDLSTYATISQSFPDDWGDFLIGKKLTFSAAVSDSYAEYQNAQWYVYSYTFTAQQGYTGWLQFPYPQQLQFGIHFNTEYNGHIENEITLRFNNIWVHALKLEIGETETLSTDLMKPCDCYEQARICEKYIQSCMMDGLIHVDQMDGYTGTDAISPFAEIQNYVPYIKDDKVYVNIPVDKPFMSKPRIEIYDANGKDISNIDNPLSIRVNATSFPTDIAISNYVPGGHYIQLMTDVTKSQILPVLEEASQGSDNDIHSMVMGIDYNIIFTCEETYNS